MITHPGLRRVVNRQKAHSSLIAGLKAGEL